MKCEYCGENEGKINNNQADLVCFDCENDSSIKCHYCNNIAENKSQIHNDFYFCTDNKCLDNYLKTYCIENILN